MYLNWNIIIEKIELLIFPLQQWATNKMSLLYIKEYF